MTEINQHISYNVDSHLDLNYCKSDRYNWIWRRKNKREDGII